jgi:alkylation response protein AidB-like acyl-CoA dehydrogenase
VSEALHGHLPSTHPLSIRSALAGAIPLARYAPQSLWEQDTRTLPWALRRYRRKMRRFAQTELRPHALAFDIAAHDQPPHEVLRRAAAAGMLTDPLPWPIGSAPPWLLGHALQLLSSLKMEELCAACGGLGLLLGAHVLGCAPIILAGNLGSVLRLLGPLYRRNKRGEPAVVAFAITEPSAGSDVEESLGAAAHRPGTVARRVNGGFVLNGRKVFISGGDIACACTVFAALEGEGMESWTCFYVDAKTQGLSVVRTELKMGQRASGAAELQLEDVFVPDSCVVGTVRGGWSLARVTLNFSRIPVGAIALGIARGAMDAAIDFVCSFQLGRKPLIDYQEVQLAAAQMIAETTAMRGLLWQSARVFTPTQAKASITKLYCADRAVAVCDQAMDLLGNHALLHANYVEKAFRDARLTQIYEGTNQINRLAVIEDVQEQLLARVAGKP